MCWVLDNAFSIHTVTASFMYDRYLYVGNEDFCIRVWNIQTSSLYRKLMGHTSIITGFAHSSKYDLLFSVGIDGNFITWHGNTMINKYTHFRPPENRFPSPIYSVYFNPELEIIAIGLDCEVATFELLPNVIDVLVDNSNRCPFNLRQVAKVHNDRVHFVIGGGRKLYTASFDRTVCSSTILDVTINKTISRHQTAVSSMIFSEAVQQLIIGDNSGIIRTFSADGLSLGPIAEGLNGSITSLFFDQSLHLLWFVVSSGEINLMDIQHPNVYISDHFQIFQKLPLAGSDTSNFERVLGNGLNSRIVALVNHKYIYSWYFSEMAYSFKISASAIYPVSRLHGFSYVEDETKLSSKRREKGSSMIELAPAAKVNSSLVNHGLNVFVSGTKIITCRPVSEFVYQIDNVSQSADCTSIAYNYIEASIVLGFKDGRLTSESLSNSMHYVGYHGNNVRVFELIAFGINVISLGDDMSMSLWNIHDKLEQVQRRDRIHDARVTCAAFCERRNQLLTCDEDGFCRLWSFNIIDFKEELLLDHCAYGAVSHCAYSDTADAWICASADGIVRVWSGQNPLNSPTFNFNVRPCHVTALAAGPASDALIATDDKTIRLMALRGAEEKGIYTGHTDLVTQIFVPPFGKRWVSLQWNGDVYFWMHKNSIGIKSDNSTNTSTTAAQTSRLPLLIKRNEQPRVHSSSEKEKPLSFYEKQRKTLLLKRREEEWQLKMKKKSHTWKMLESITKQMERAMDIKEERKKQELDNLPSNRLNRK